MPSIEVDDDLYLRVSLKLAKQMLTDEQLKELDDNVAKQMSLILEEE
jgi:hypothetical protein